jgi:hypothetical protein
MLWPEALRLIVSMMSRAIVLQGVDDVLRHAERRVDADRLRITNDDRVEEVRAEVRAQAIHPPARRRPAGGSQLEVDRSHVA